MVPVEKLVNDFYRKHNAANNGKGLKYNVVDVISYLNEAYQIWFENKVFMAETNQKVRNDLRVFEIKKEKLDCKEVDCDCCVVEYPDNFYQLLNQTVTACNKECCPNVKKEIIARIVQADDLEEARRNPYRKSDFKWEQLIADEGSGGLYIFHDGSMDIEKVTISYYRKPNLLEAGELVKCGDGYRKYDNTYITFNIDLEADDTFADRQITDIAALLASRDEGKVQDFQIRLQSIVQQGVLHKQ